MEANAASSCGVWALTFAGVPGGGTGRPSRRSKRRARKGVWVRVPPPDQPPPADIFVSGQRAVPDS